MLEDSCQLELIWSNSLCSREVFFQTKALFSLCVIYVVSSKPHYGRRRMHMHRATKNIWVKACIIFQPPPPNLIWGTRKNFSANIFFIHYDTDHMCINHRVISEGKTHKDSHRMYVVGCIVVSAVRPCWGPSCMVSFAGGNCRLEELKPNSHIMLISNTMNMDREMCGGGHSFGVWKFFFPP